MIDVFSALEDFGDGEEPWCDLLFRLPEVKAGWFSSTTVINQIADWNGSPVGFSSQIDSRAWEFHPATDDKPVSVWWGSLKLSGGSNGAALCQLWREFFKIDGSARFADDISVQAVALEGNPTKLKDGPVRMKLFFDNGNPDEYAELYYNVDLKTGYAALNEKDPEYRAPLLRWISGEVGNA